MTKPSDPLHKLSEILSTVCDSALELHEKFEKSGEKPIEDFERYILSGNRRFSDEVRANVIWHLLLFTEPRLQLQKKFQTSLNARMPSPDAAIVVRQLLCSPPKAWSYRHSYQRGFAHPLAGPNAHTEISIDGCLSASGTILEDDHLYGIGWTLTFEDQIFFVHTSALNQNQVYEIESCRPFPLPQKEDDFWEEHLLKIVQNLFNSLPFVKETASIAPQKTAYEPEHRFERLAKILMGSLSSGVVRTRSSLHISAATETPEQIVENVRQTVQSSLTKSDIYMFETLCERTLEAIGCDSDGQMPRAHQSLLTGDPLGLLLLPEAHPIFQHLSPRDSIRQALQCEDFEALTEINQAYQIYQRERRWLAAFPCFDFTIEEHATKFGLPVDMIKQIFDPRLLSSHLPIVPQGEALKQLQNKFGFYMQDAQPPVFGMVLDAMTSRSFQKTGMMSSIVQWFMTYCDRWRYCLCEIEPDNAQRKVSKSNQKLLQKGLKDLSAMFKKK